MVLFENWTIIYILVGSSSCIACCGFGIFLHNCIPYLYSMYIQDTSVRVRVYSEDTAPCESDFESQ